jgi:hypothetical protein
MVRGTVVYDLYGRFIQGGYWSGKSGDWSKSKREENFEEEARREQLVYRALCWKHHDEFVQFDEGDLRAGRDCGMLGEYIELRAKISQLVQDIQQIALRTCNKSYREVEVRMQLEPWS